MAENESNVILIFVKNPEKGHVKTRLAQSIGDEKALQVYQKLLQKTKEVTLTLTCTRQVWYSKKVEENDGWDSVHYSKFSQQGDSLGNRMKFAFQQAFKSGFKKVIIIGSDCAELTDDLINEAFEMLESKEAVIGPSKDGGYYLLGMSTFYPFLFDDKTWSTDTVFEDTQNQLNQKSISHHILPVLNDIDDIHDLNKSKHLSL